MLEQLLDLLIKLSPSGSEGPLAAEFAAWARDAGFSAEVQDHGPGRASAVISFENGQGPHLLFSGHIDTLPSPTPHPSLTGLHGGRYHGPEVNNMKAALAAMLTAMAGIRDSGARGKVTLLAAAGECDVMGLGTVSALRSGLNADWAINGEPTDLQVLLGHAGVARLKITAHGTSAHVSKVDDVDNAVEHLVTALAGLTAAKLNMATSDEFPGMPVLNVGRIEGGMVPSMSAESATAYVDIRWPPGGSAAGIAESVRAHISAAGEDKHVTVDVLSEPEFMHPGPFLTDPQWMPVVAVSVAHAEVTGRECHQGYLQPQIFFGSDAPHLVAVGIPTCMYGPGRINDINSENESVSWQDVITAASVYEAAGRKLLAAQP
jgi:acetylornithine deacetylase/succinyl-diaminopimelate desuccinylase-like protein